MTETLVVLATNRVSGLKRQAAEDPRYRMIIFTEHKYRADYEAAGFDPVFSVPAMEDLTAVRGEFARLLESIDTVGVIGGTERAVQPAGFVRSYFGLAGPGFEECARLTDKYAMKRAWRAAGLPVAEFQAIRGLDQFREAVSSRPLPLIIKPSRGTGAVHITAVTTESEREAALVSPPSYVSTEDYYTLIEKKLDVIAEYHVDAVISGGVIMYDLVGRYFAPPMNWREPGPRGSYTVHPDDPAHGHVDSLATAAVAALNVTDGVTHCEIFETAEGFVVGEIAGRPGGGSCSPLMKHHLGVNAWDAFVATTLGREVPRGIENDTSQVIACVMLPEAERPVADWTPADEIAALPGVDEVVVTCRAGRTSGYRHSSVGSGYVVFHADADDVTASATRIAESFRLVYA